MVLLVILPVGNINVDDAGLKEFPIQVSACSQEPSLVMGKTVSDKQHIVFLRCFAKCLPELRLLVLHWCQDEWRSVQTQTLWPLQIGGVKSLE